MIIVRFCEIFDNLYARQMYTSNDCEVGVSHHT